MHTDTDQICTIQFMFIHSVYTFWNLNFEYRALYVHKQNSNFKINMFASYTAYVESVLLLRTRSLITMYAITTLRYMHFLYHFTKNLIFHSIGWGANQMIEYLPKNLWARYSFGLYRRKRASMPYGCKIHLGSIGADDFCWKTSHKFINVKHIIRPLYIYVITICELCVQLKEWKIELHS